MAGSGTPSVVTPRTVAAIVGGACIVALAMAAIESGGTIAAAGGPAVEGWLGLGLVVLGLLAFAAGAALRYRRSVPDGAGRERGLVLDAPEIRALLERWYPHWEDRRRRTVAETISYHRRRRGPHD